MLQRNDEQLLIKVMTMGVPDAHSSYITYVFGTTFKTFSVSEGSRKAIKVFGCIRECMLDLCELESAFLCDPSRS